MADMNSVNIVGRLTKDAEKKTIGSKGTTLVSFSLANNRGFGDNAKVHFFDVKFWGKGADACSKYLVKGKRVGVSGELQLEQWEQDGNKRSKVVINTFDVQLMDGGTERDDVYTERDDVHAKREERGHDEEWENMPF